jgi:hypothetical protein
MENQKADGNEDREKRRWGWGNKGQVFLLLRTDIRLLLLQYPSAAPLLFSSSAINPSPFGSFNGDGTFGRFVWLDRWRGIDSTTASAEMKEVEKGAAPLKPRSPLEGEAIPIPFIHFCLCPFHNRHSSRPPFHLPIPSFNDQMNGIDEGRKSVKR